MPRHCSVSNMVATLCDTWLKSARGLETGDVHAHVWSVRNRQTRCCGPFEHTWRGFAAASRSLVVRPATDNLESVLSELGDEAVFEYDLALTSRAVLRVVSIAKDKPGVVKPVTPFRGQADKEFPRLSKFLLRGFINCFWLFGFSEHSMAVAEAGIIGDALVAPTTRFESAAELLRACDCACVHARVNALIRAGVRPDTITRLVYPSVRMPPKLQREYHRGKARYHAQPASQSRLVFCRQQPADRNAFLAKSEFNAAFPKTSAAFHAGDHWLMYRNSTLVIGCGRIRMRQANTHRKVRSIPHHLVYAKFKYRFTSLHHLFQAAESLWPPQASPGVSVAIKQEDPWLSCICKGGRGKQSCA